MSAPCKELDRMKDHRDDLRAALLILELIDEEQSGETPKLANLIALGMLAIGSKLELMDGLIENARKQGGAA